MNRAKNDSLMIEKALANHKKPNILEDINRVGNDMKFS